MNSSNRPYYCFLKHSHTKFSHLVKHTNLTYLKTLVLGFHLSNGAKITLVFNLVAFEIKLTCIMNISIILTIYLLITPLNNTYNIFLRKYFLLMNADDSGS